MLIKYYKQILISFILLCFLVLTSFPAWAQGKQEVFNVYFFYSQTCPHCTKQKPLMEYIDQNNENIKVNFFEVSQEQEKWQEFLEKNNIASGAVPRTFIGDKSFIGYTESEGELEYNSVYLGYIGYKNQIINAIEAEVDHKINLPDEARNREASNPNLPGSNQAREPSQLNLPWQVFFIPILYLFSYPVIKKKFQDQQLKRYWLGGLITTVIISLFLFITLTSDTVIRTFAQTLPFPLFVSTIALADGFNPCAFTVLIILLSLLTYTKSRKDMTLVGTTFIATSAIMYFIFIMLMVMVGSVFLEKYGNIFMLVLGGIITIAGAINIKDYFFFKRGVSLSLSQKQQLDITKKAGKIVRTLKSAEQDKRMFWVALGATIVLAVFVNIIELGCTAILPAVYMSALIQYCTQNVWLCRLTWTAFYSILYIIPLLVILFNFIYSFKSDRITEKQGRNLKLLGGLFMLFLGLAMIFKPELLLFG